MLTGRCPHCGTEVRAIAGFDTWAHEAEIVQCMECMTTSGYAVIGCTLVYDPTVQEQSLEPNG